MRIVQILACLNVFLNGFIFVYTFLLAYDPAKTIESYKVCVVAIVLNFIFGLISSAYYFTAHNTLYSDINSLSIYLVPTDYVQSLYN